MSDRDMILYFAFGLRPRDRNSCRYRRLLCWPVVRYAASRWNLLDVFVLALQFHEIGDVEKGIALQSDIHERGLHSWQHPGDSSFVN